MASFGWGKLHTLPSVPFPLLHSMIAFVDEGFIVYLPFPTVPYDGYFSISAWKMHFVQLKLGSLYVSIHVTSTILILWLHVSVFFQITSSVALGRVSGMQEFIQDMLCVFAGLCES